MDTVRIEAKNLQWRAFQAEGEWVAICDALAVTATGATTDDLSSTIHEILNHLFRDLWKTGELPSFLHDRGWIAHGLIPAPNTGDAPRFDVPASVLYA